MLFFITVTAENTVKEFTNLDEKVNDFGFSLNCNRENSAQLLDYFILHITIIIASAQTILADCGLRGSVNANMDDEIRESDR